MELIWCKDKGQRVIVESCASCKKFPCKEIPKESIEGVRSKQQESLLKQGYVETIVYMQKKEECMLVKWKTGKIEEVEELSQDLETINKLECVYVIQKVLYPSLTLRPRKEDEGVGMGNTGMDGMVKKRRRRKKSEMEEASTETESKE